MRYNGVWLCGICGKIYIDLDPSTPMDLPPIVHKTLKLATSSYCGENNRLSLCVWVWVSVSSTRCHPICVHPHHSHNRRVHVPQSKILATTHKIKPPPCVSTRLHSRCALGHSFPHSCTTAARSVYGGPGEPGEPLYGYTGTPFTPVCLHVHRASAGRGSHAPQSSHRFQRYPT